MGSEALSYLIQGVENQQLKDQDIVFRFLLKFQILKVKNYQIDENIKHRISRVSFKEFDSLSKQPIFAQQIKECFSRFICVQNLNEQLGEFLKNKLYMVFDDFPFVLVDNQITAVCIEEDVESTSQIDQIIKNKGIQESGMVNLLRLFYHRGGIMTTILKEVSQNLNQALGKKPQFHSCPIICLNLPRESNEQDFYLVFKKLSQLCQRLIQLITKIDIDPVMFLKKSIESECKAIIETLEPQANQNNSISQAEYWFSSLFQLDLIHYMQQTLSYDERRKNYNKKLLIIQQKVNLILKQMENIKIISQNDFELRCRLLTLLKLIWELFNNQNQENKQIILKQFEKVFQKEKVFQNFNSLIQRYGLLKSDITNFLSSQETVKAYQNTIVHSLESEQLQVVHIMKLITIEEFKEILLKIYYHSINNNQFFASQVNPPNFGIKYSQEMNDASSALALTHGNTCTTVFYLRQIKFQIQKEYKLLGLISHELTHKFIDSISKLKSSEQSMAIDQQFPEQGLKTFEAGLYFEKQLYGDHLELGVNQNLNKKHCAKIKYLCQDDGQKKALNQIKAKGNKKLNKRKKGQSFARYSDTSESQSQQGKLFKKFIRLTLDTKKYFQNIEQGNLIRFQKIVLNLDKEQDQQEQQDEEIIYQNKRNSRAHLPIYTPIHKETRLERGKRLGLAAHPSHRAQIRRQYEIEQKKKKRMG